MCTGTMTWTRIGRTMSKMAQVRHQKDEMVVWTDWDPGIEQGATLTLRRDPRTWEVLGVWNAVDSERLDRDWAVGGLERRSRKPDTQVITHELQKERS